MFPEMRWPESRRKIFEREEQGGLGGGTYGVDGTGGPHTREPLIRRAAWAFARLKEAEGVMDYDNVCTGVLEGEVQSAPRAELIAIEEVLKEVKKEERLEVVSDHWNHVKAWRMGKAHCMALANSDVWWSIWKELREREGSFSLVWCPSHTAEDKSKAEKWTGLLQPERVYINDVVDKKAGKRGEEEQQPEHVVKACKELIEKASNIVERNALIAIRTSEEHKEERVEKVRLTKEQKRLAAVQRLMAASEHRWRAGQSDYWRCTRCWAKARKGTNNDDSGFHVAVQGKEMGRSEGTLQQIERRV